MAIRNDDNDVFVGDVGTILLFDTGEDVTAATLLEIKVTKPDGTSTTWNGTASGNNISYTITTNDLDQAGEYILQPYAEFLAWSGHGSRCYLVVKEHE